MDGSEEIFKVTVNVPEEFLERLMDSINSVMEPVYPGYDRTFSYSRVTGTWRPLSGSSPYKGTVGKIEISDEIGLEFVVKRKDLRKVIDTIEKIHPYEEPAIDITRTYSPEDIVQSL
ncbi:MAG: hypothetical protein LBH69_02030 [Methanomassiliicoccaceae archaeon]|jgi:hypothetical protein|nr:hypothetical protein [Methanomassiliicoccaceae archaeon]